ncbi:hypothetical protein [Armatimonas sp.]|uniref:hypothetical protein n=1 Tax=Armatimonas sp. TaxID=1872638 RepID=UPI0037511D86
MDTSPITQLPENRIGPGRPPGLKTQLTSLLLEPELIDWAKRQPEGLSGVVRQLLRVAMESDTGMSKAPGQSNVPRE